MSTQNSFVSLGLTMLLAVVATGRSVQNTTITDARMYLSNFKYLPVISPNSDHVGILDDKTGTKAMDELQNSAGLNLTVELDEETKKIISLPRCGVRDKVFRTNNRPKRYSLRGSRWTSKDLTYRIESYPLSLHKSDVDAEIARAFAAWGEYTDLIFTPKTTGDVNIKIKFVIGEHGDGYPFTAKDGALAHAFSPKRGGDVHFDADEMWTINSYEGINLYEMAVHEIGHALGLDHSDESTAIMSPIYNGYNPDIKLHDDDILAIQHLYGNKTSQSTSSLHPTSTTHKSVVDLPSGRPNKELCNDPKIDTIFHTAGNETYVFKGDKYYKLKENSVADGYPKLISKGWPGLPGNIDAAFTHKRGNTFFFKGTQLWQYNVERKLLNGYPKKISDVFFGIPDHLDTAMVLGTKGIILFFKGNQVWLFDISDSRPIMSIPLANYKAFPGNLDAAIQHTDGCEYFFKDDKFHAYVKCSNYENAPIAFNIGSRWFGC